jgi:membrane fusion protein YbhG
MRARLLLPLGFLAACVAGDGGDYSGTVELRDIRVGSLVGGRVLSVEAREGDPIAKGSTLLQLDPREWNATLAEARAQADAAGKRLALLEAGTRKEAIDQAEAEAERERLLWQVIARGSRIEEVEEARRRADAAKADAELAAIDLKRKIDLAKGGAGPEEDVDRARKQLEEAEATFAAFRQRLSLLEAGFRKEEIDAAEAGYRKALARLAELKAGPRPEEIAAARAEGEAARSRVEFVESKIAELAVLAPSDAIVQTLDLRPGDLVQAGQTAAVLLLPEECFVTVFVPEDRLASVSLGRKARARFDGLATPLAGKVTWISREAEFTPRNVQTRSERVTQVFAVRVTLEGNLSPLKDGLWADVTFE